MFTAAPLVLTPLVRNQKPSALKMSPQSPVASTPGLAAEWTFSCPAFLGREQARQHPVNLRRSGSCGALLVHGPAACVPLLPHAGLPRGAKRDLGDGFRTSPAPSDGAHSFRVPTRCLFSACLFAVVGLHVSECSSKGPCQHVLGRLRSLLTTLALLDSRSIVLQMVL